MSISNITNRNNYDLFARSFNVKEFIAEALQATNMDITGELIANKIVNNIGFNYLSPWDPTKNYITNDLVISNNQIFRCLVANTNVEPDPNNPAQPEFVAVTSNNAILSERQYAQIHLTNGNDVKALVSAIPFQSVPAALDYLKSVGGGYAKIMSIGQNNVYGDGSSLVLFEYDNIILDGGDASDSYLDNPQNKINYLIDLQGSNNVTFKNFTISKTSPVICATDGCNNISFQNVTFEDNAAPAPQINISGSGLGFGNHTFTNCYMTPGSQAFINVVIYDVVATGTRIIFDNNGLVTRSYFRPDTQNVDPGTAANLTIIIRNSYISAGFMTHIAGMKFIFENCIIKGALTSSVASGSITLTNCSLFDPIDNTWGTINLSGSAEYKIANSFIDPNNDTNNVNLPGNVNSFNYTMGPAARFNRVLRIGPGLNTSTGTTQSAVTVIPGALVNNLWNIATYDGVAGSLTFTTRGTYQLCTCLQIANTSTAAEQTVLSFWFGAAGSTESTALAASSTDRPFVGSAGILSSFPTSLKGVPLLVTVPLPLSTPYFFFMRSLSGVAYNVSIVNLGVVQIR